MRYNNSKNIMNGMLFGAAYRILMVILPFILRTCIIYVLGIEYAGLNSLFTSILSALSMTELGFAGAIVYSMYKPIAEENYEKINALLNYYRKVYRIIGVIILALGLLLTPFLKYIISSDCPDDLNIYILYFGYLLNSCCSYFCMSYRSSILTAYQREDITSKINGIVVLAGYILQIISIILFKNYYLYLLIVILLTVIANLSRAIYTMKAYPKLKCEGKLVKEERGKITTNVKALFLQKIGNIVSVSFDNIIISSFLGLTIVAVYGNYNYIMSSVMSFFTLFYNVITAGIGNSMVLDSPEKNYTQFKKYSFISNWAVTWATCCLVCLYQPFIELWVGEEYQLSMVFVVLISFLFYVTCTKRVVTSHKDAAGLWRKDRFRPLIAAFANLACNILMVKYIGIVGVVLSTILSYVVIEMPWETIVLFKTYFNRGAGEYFRILLFDFIRMLIIVFCTFGICIALPIKNAYLSFVVRFMICLIVPNIALYVFHIRDENERWALAYVKNKVMRRL